MPLRLRTYARPRGVPRVLWPAIERVLWRRGVSHERRRCLNCGDLYPWWRRTCKHHVFKVRVVPASQDPYEHLRKLRADGSVNW